MNLGEVLPLAMSVHQTVEWTYRQTKPSSVFAADSKPPAWMRSTEYFAVHATKWPLSTENSGVSSDLDSMVDIRTDPLLAVTQSALDDRTKRRLDSLRGQRRHQQSQGDERVASEILSSCRSVSPLHIYLIQRQSVRCTDSEEAPPASRELVAVRQERDLQYGNCRR